VTPWVIIVICTTLGNDETNNNFPQDDDKKPTQRGRETCFSHVNIFIVLWSFFDLARSWEAIKSASKFFSFSAGSFFVFSHTFSLLLSFCFAAINTRFISIIVNSSADDLNSHRMLLWRFWMKELACEWNYDD
jgi:hypothetical protein